MQELADLFADLSAHLDERQRRLLMGAQARRLGRGGIALVAEAAQVNRKTVARGIEELERPPTSWGRARAPGAGRPRATEADNGLAPALDALMQPRGIVGAALRWTTCSVRQLADALTSAGHPASTWTVRRLLRDSGYRLAPGRRAADGWSPAARDRQFRYLSAQATEFLRAGDPVVSLQACRLVSTPVATGVEGHQRLSAEISGPAASDPGRSAVRALPDADSGGVPIGRDEETSTFAVQTLRRWWTLAGVNAYPCARRMLLCADGGSAIHHRAPWLAAELARLSADAGLLITVCHLPPGTSRWTRVEHRACEQFALDLPDHRATTDVVTLDVVGRPAELPQAAVAPVTGPAPCPPGHRSVSTITRHDLNGDWNYTVAPQ